MRARRIAAWAAAAVLATVLVAAAWTFGWLPFGGGEENRLGADDAGSVVEVAVGEQVVVVLEGNPTTGYGWEVAEIDESVLVLAGDPDYESESDADGAGGTYTFRFEAVAPGETALTLVYRRSWEPAEEPLDSFSVTVVVD